MHTFRTLEDASYYTRETEAGAGETWGYYDDGDTGRQEEAGVWHGDLAAAFGLSGRIRKEDFERLMAGQSPSGKKLVRTAWTPEEAREKSAAVAQARRDVAAAERFARKELGLSKDDEAALAADPTVADARRRLAAAEKALKHRAGFDYTVSPPKGFSLALETVTPEMRAELDAVFDEAVEEVVQMIQDHSHVRKGKGGANVERSAGIACASFKHRTTRPVEMVVDGQPRLVPDPQIHAHIVIANLSASADGKTRTLTTDAFGGGRFRAYADAKTNAKLAKALRDRGIKIEPKVLKCGSVTFQLAGMEEVEKTFSRRREQILEAEEKAEAEGKPFDRGVAAMTTRGKKISELSMDELRELWAQEFKALGLTFEALQQARAVDYTPRTNSQIVDALTTREVGFGMMDLERALWEEAQFYDFDVQERLDSIVRDESLLARSCATNGKSAVHRKQLELCALEGEPLFVSKRQLAQQIEIGKRLEELSKHGGADLTEEQAEAAIRKMEEQRSSEGKPFKLRLDQADVARAFCLARGFLALTAFAGTGKTTSADAVAIAHRDAGFEVVGFAPSGKASDQFAVDTKTDSFTFESFALRFDKWVKEKRAGDKVLFMVDEAGMATLEQFDKMTKQAMELRRRGVAVKILIQGDVRQLPPVGAGAPFAWIVETGAGGKLPEAQRLTDITRQFDDWAKEASYEASMGDFEAACAKYADRGRILTKASRPALVRQMIADFEACPLPAEEKILLAHKNDEVRMLNEMARKGQVAAGKVLADQGAVVPTLIDDNEGTLEIAPGDRIILRKNDRKLGVSNGQLGTVGAVEADGRGGFLATVRVDGKADPVRLPLREGAGGYLAIERGYACTIHKSQGGTWKEAFMVHSGEGAELSLVAMTRHRAGLRIYTQEADIGRMSRQMSAAAGKANPLDYLGEDEVRALTGQSREGRAVVHVGEKVREATSALDATPRIEPTRIAEEAAAVSDLAAEARRVAADLGQAIANASDRIGRKIKEQRLDRSERRRIAQIEDPKRRAAAQAVLDLMDAARDGDKPKIEELLASGMSPILVDRSGRTASEVAESAGKRETAEWLRSVEADFWAEVEARRAGVGADAVAGAGRPAFKGARGPVMDFSKATIFIQEPKPAAGAPAATPTEGPAQATPSAAPSPAPAPTAAADLIQTPATTAPTTTATPPAPPKPIRRPRGPEQGMIR